ncbi:hypothetical protein [Corynebacterium mastitidis]|uniref:hypothetical protein n=1 Tax=Corynebacterium mastitidis TaxID=161890 RepID=UPI00254F0615|nr:hypothetical protein [Corynebacterium mastitidis]MDK8450214.1 hypothetical protein [Corynebacterium mastitidis]
MARLASLLRRTASAVAALGVASVASVATPGAGPAVATPPAGPTIDVLVLYPGEVVADRGGEAATKGAIEKSMALMTDTLNRASRGG